ncbi:hypothetical protein [Lacipirellula sp.]|uniref:hypothetical protein n=1 Tax=Lacipirellula sp. TaxID=2691419 RepID=UPI003D0F7D59
MNFGDRVKEVHREILSTPHGDLPQEFVTEAVWRGEAAYFLGWAIQLFDKPHPSTFTDPGALTGVLQLLQPDANELVPSARLRAHPEIDDYSALCLLIRHLLQLQEMQAGGRDSLERAYQSRLAKLGLSPASNRLEPGAADAVISSTAKDSRGLYVVRSLAAEWLLGEEE